jgi:hypothetical protein
LSQPYLFVVVVVVAFVTWIFPTLIYAASVL